MTKSTLVRRGFILTYKLQFIIKGSQGRSWSRDHRGTGLAQLAFFYHSEPGVAPPTRGSPTSITNREMPYRLAHREYDGDISPTDILSSQMIQSVRLAKTSSTKSFSVSRKALNDPVSTHQTEQWPSGLCLWQVHQAPPTFLSPPPVLTSLTQQAKFCVYYFFLCVLF